MAAMRTYATLPAGERDELTGLLADMAARFDALKLSYIEQSDKAAYDVSRQQLHVAARCDAMIRAFTALGGGDTAAVEANARDLSMADTVEWILQREERIVILAHNAHIQRQPADLAALGPPPTAPMGQHLAARLGEQYLVIGTTCASGEVISYESVRDTRMVIFDLPPAGTDSIDGLIAATRSEPGVLDLRSVGPADAALIDAATQMRAVNLLVGVKSVRQAFDLLVHIPHLSLWHSPMTAAMQDAGELTRAEA